MVIRNFLVVALAMVATAVVSPAYATPIISTFDTDADGWTVYQNVGGVIAYETTGGNPDGHIHVDDIDNQWAYVQAPGKFNVAALYGGTLSFDLKHSNQATNVWPVEYDVRVGLQGNGLTLLNESVLPTSSWENYSFTLTETTGWLVSTSLDQNYGSGTQPTALEMAGVLANLTGLFIATDYTDYNYDTDTLSLDRTFLDNVRLDAAVPEPTTLTLAALSLLGLLAHGHRRRRA